MEFVFIKNLRLFVFTLLYGQFAFCDDNLRSSYVEKLSSYSLAGSSQQNVTKSEVRCKYACLQDEENCVAYQWDAANGSCKMQDKLNITFSAAAEDVVGVMMGDSPVIDANDCADILATDPTSESGVYFIMVAGQFLRPVWCDMDTDGGGWTVFLKRFDGSMDFYQDGAAYKAGFGDLSGEYWLGLDALHAITASKTYELRADISDWEGASVYSLHESMMVADETEQYQLTLGPFLEGEGGDGLLHNQGEKFSTIEVDLDNNPGKHCAVTMHGPFWYDWCSLCFPTSKYYIGGPYISPNYDGMAWQTWPAHTDPKYSMKTLDMKLRP